MLFTFLIIVTAASAKDCPYGKLLGKEDAYEFIFFTKHLTQKTYNEEQAYFIKGVRAEQIKKVFKVKTIKAAFESAVVLARLEDGDIRVCEKDLLK